MPLYKAQAILPFFTNLPTDVINNQFHFLDDTTDSHDVVAQDIADQLTRFYTDVYLTAPTGRVGYIDWAQAHVKVFKLSDPTPRVPVIKPLIFSAGTGSSTIPTEVACVLTWSAAPESGVRYQRLYNRIYLGGIPNTFMDQSAADQFPRFLPAVTSRIAAAAATLAIAAIPTPTQWVQVSNAGGVTAVRQIVGGWVDNGPDTQRRRSVLATLRSNWNVTP